MYKTAVALQPIVVVVTDQGVVAQGAVEFVESRAAEEGIGVLSAFEDIDVGVIRSFTAVLHFCFQPI